MTGMQEAEKAGQGVEGGEEGEYNRCRFRSRFRANAQRAETQYPVVISGSTLINTCAIKRR